MFTVYADGQLLYSSVMQETNAIVMAGSNLNVGKTGTLDFVILPVHYLYSTLQKYKTRIVAYMDATEIFRGRVLTWSLDFYDQKTVHCEGNLSYLLDSVQPPRRVEMTVSAFFTEILAEHNLQVEDDKKFTLGIVTIAAAATIAKFDTASFRDTRSAIDSDLIGVYGGLLRTRTVGAVTYLDYIENYGTTISQKLEFAVNILDMNRDTSSTEIFTVLLPTGDSIDSEPGLPPLPLTIESVNSGSKLLEHLDGISKFGRIIHTENFPGITDPTALKIAGLAYIERVYIEPYFTFAIRALDLHLFDALIEQFAVGNLIQILSTPHGINTTLTCLSIKYDFVNVENTEFTLGPLLSNVGEKKGTASSGKSLSESVGEALGGSGGKGGTIGEMYKHITEGVDWLKIEALKIELIAGDLTTHGSRLTVTENQIALEVTNRTTQGENLSAALTVEANKINAEVIRSSTSEGELAGRITVEADKITAEVTRAQAGEAELSGRIVVEADRIGLEVAERIAGNITLSGRIDVTATNISLAVTDSTDRDNVLSGRISVSSDAIVAEVGRAIGKEGELSGRITVTEANIDLRVTKAGIVGFINITPEIIKINANKILLTGVGGIIAEGSLAIQGDLSALNASFNNLISGTAVATQLRASHILSTGNMGVNGTLTAGRLETTGVIVGGEVSGTNIYAGTAIFLAGINLQTTLNNKASDAALGSANNAITILQGTVNNTHTPQITSINDTLYAHGQSLLTKLSTSGKAADSDLLDGYHAGYFAYVGHGHDYSGSFLGLHATADYAANSNLLDGYDWSDFSLSGHNHASLYSILAHTHDYSAVYAPLAHSHYSRVSKYVLTDAGVTVGYVYAAGIRCVGSVTLTKSGTTIYYYT